MVNKNYRNAGYKFTVAQDHEMESGTVPMCYKAVKGRCKLGLT